MQMEKQQFYKMVPYDASASVPMIIHDARPGRQNPTAGPEISHPTQLIDIYPTILTLAQVPESKWPTLDGKSLTTFMATVADKDTEDKVAAAGAVVVPGSSGSSNRPDFVVSQFHGDNIAMSWFLVVKEGVTPPGKTNTANARLASPHLTSTASATVIINALLWLVCIVRAAD
jgi:arylsulfatase A-like enzyme